MAAGHVKFRLFINTLEEQFWFFLTPGLECINRRKMPQSALRDLVVEAAHQGVFDVLMAPISGFYNQNTGMANAIDVSLFVLIIGGFLEVVNATGAINTGIERVMLRMKRREKWMIPVLMLRFAIGGSTCGMAEETRAFYVLLPR